MVVRRVCPYKSIAVSESNAADVILHENTCFPMIKHSSGDYSNQASQELMCSQRSVISGTY